MPGTPVTCPHCGYEIATFSEALEALEGGSRCLLCGGQLSRSELEKAVDGWSDEELVQVGEGRAQDEADWADEEDLFEGVADFGDEGEDEEDPLF